jgi:protein-S-isoprenylcysteine O-methyltransferase Ste14
MLTTPLLIAYALWAIFVITWHAAGARSVRTVSTADTKRERLYSLFIVFGWSSMVMPPGMEITPKLWTNPPLVEWAMIGVIAAGFGWCWWSRLHLGRLWSASVARKEGHRIVDTGPYRIVRHPIYTGFLVSYTGLAIICATALALAAVACFTIGLWLKARLEERFLCEELGAAAYATYKARTPMLVPRVELLESRQGRSST